LTKDEIERLCRAARAHGRHGHRDATMIWVAFVHGLRVEELIRLQIGQYDFNSNVVQIVRVKHGGPSAHPISRREAAALKKILDGRRSGNVFLSERGAPFKRNAINKIIQRAGETMAVEGQAEPGIGFRVHAHMLRHSCGYDMVQQGIDIRIIQHWLGHKNINHTVGYTNLSADVFKNVSFD
jgi:type 1 fimbriae regulatory protein FimB/type 1 fimbriae regulatory protein FimE